MGENRSVPQPLHKDLRKPRDDEKRFILFSNKREKNLVEVKRTNRYVGILGPDHLQLTLLNWETKNVLALNKKLKVNWKFDIFI